MYRKKIMRWEEKREERLGKRKNTTRLFCDPCIYSVILNTQSLAPYGAGPSDFVHTSNSHSQQPQTWSQKQQVVIDMTEPNHQPVANAISTGSPPGLLDLPSEVRLMIFRHLLVHPRGVSFRLWPGEPQPSVAILRTSRIIHREAFDVLYKENKFVFVEAFWFSSCSLTQFPRVINTIRNFSIGIAMFEGVFAIRAFLNFMQYFGNPSIVRDTLTVDFFLDGPNVRPMKWFIRAIGRFTNFGSIELDFFGYTSLESSISHLREYFETALKPVLGYAECCGNEGKALRFHPIDHRNLWREPDDGDWVDSLDGIRVGWNESVANPDDNASPDLREENYLNWIRSSEYLGFFSHGILAWVLRRLLRSWRIRYWC